MAKAFVLNARLRGKRAQASGTSFERQFKVMCEKEGIICTRIPDGCKTVRGNRMVRVKTPFDWVITSKGILAQKIALIDTKSIDAVSFPHSAIEKHQVEELSLHESSTTLAGYIVWLRQSDRILFISASYMVKCLMTRGSIECTSNNMSSVIDLGSSLDCRIRDRLFHC